MVLDWRMACLRDLHQIQTWLAALGPIVVNPVAEFATVVGTSVNPARDYAGHTNTIAKVFAKGSQCNTFSSSTSVTCNADSRPTPACCSSFADSATCDTFDNGGRVTCASASNPYPSCCQDRYSISEIESKHALHWLSSCVANQIFSVGS